MCVCVGGCPGPTKKSHHSSKGGGIMRWAGMLRCVKSASGLAHRLGWAGAVAPCNTLSSH